MKRQLLRALTLWKDDRGVALPLALMALMVLGALSAALLTIGGSEVQISYNHLRGTQAQFMAEAGLEDVFNFYRVNTSKLPGFTATAAATCADITLSGPGTALLDYGTYSVTCKVLGPNTVLITSTGTTKIGSGKKVLRAIITNGFASDDAVRTDGNFDISGQALEVTGSCGSVHTNSNYTTSGAAIPSYSVGLTATGNVPQESEKVKRNKPEKLIPAIRTSDFLAAARAINPDQTFEYQTGTVRTCNATGTTCSTVFTYAPETVTGEGKDKVVTPVNDTHRGWKWNPATGNNPAQWTLVDATAASGPCTTTAAGVTTCTGATYYFNQDVNFNGGTMKATILATGNITTSGNFSLTPHLTATLLVSDKDIEMGGTASAGGSASTAQGLIAAHEQIDLSGNVGITGSVLTEDAADNSTVVSRTESNCKGCSVYVSGSVTINYSCDQAPPITGPVRFLAWGF